MDRNESFDALSVSALNLRLAWASLDVMVEDVDAIQLIISGDDEDVAAMRIVAENGRLTVEQPTYGLTYKLNMARWMQIFVRIPHDWKGAVDASTIAGPLSASGLTGTDLTLETVSGALHASSLTCLTAALRTMTGTLTAEQVTTEKLALRTVSGPIVYTGSCTDKLHLSSVTADLDIALTAPYAALDGNTVSGSVRVCAPLDEADVSFKAVSGRLRTRGVSIVEEGVKVNINSVSGNLELINTL